MSHHQKSPKKDLPGEAGTVTSELPLPLLVSDAAILSVDSGRILKNDLNIHNPSGSEAQVPSPGS